MTPPRKTRKTLTGTRIFVLRGNYRYHGREEILNPKTGLLQKTHFLCSVEDGEYKAREELQKLLGRSTLNKGLGNFSAWLAKFKIDYLTERELKKPKDPARLHTWAKGAKNIDSALSIIADKFADFDVEQVEGHTVAQFLSRWKGRRSAQTYKTYLSVFFEWCISMHGLIKINPAKQISVKGGKKRKVYITDKQFNDIRAALLVDEDDKEIRGGEMIRCYVDLLYLLYQRGTDIRLMRKNEVRKEGIEVTPTKTEDSSGMKVFLPMTPAIEAVLERIKKVSKGNSMFLIHSEHGKPYTASGVRSAFARACERAGIEGVTLKDIRSKAASDAKKQGFSTEQIQVALAHTDQATTRDYIRDQTVPVSALNLDLPK